jgi:hypothetical protein
MTKLLERLFPIIVIAVTVAVLAAQVSSHSQREIENVAAFARLFGVVRYFYPSDAAASLDWSRFAVYGVRRVRTAEDSAVLEAALEELFTPLGPNIEIAPSLEPAAVLGSIDSSLIAWRYEGPGIASPNPPGGYRAIRSNRGAPTLGVVAQPPQIQLGDRLDIQSLLRGLNNGARGQSRPIDVNLRKGDHIPVDLRLGRS